MKKMIKHNIPWLFALIAVIVYLTVEILKTQPEWIEKYYSSSSDKVILEIWSRITGIFPFSVGEYLVYLNVLAVPVVFALLIYSLFKGGFFRIIKIVIAYLALVYILFIGLWGLNYYREPLSQIMGLTVEPSSTADLYQVTRLLVTQADTLRAGVDEDANGVMTIPGGYKAVFARAPEAYAILGKKYPVLSGTYGGPKPVMLSKLMLYTDITGIFFPFTAEPNVNIDNPDLMLPADTLHEMAHQRGFALEDEANFIAFLAATSSPDVDFEYSGTVMALVYCMNALAGAAPDQAAQLIALYSPGLTRDLTAYNDFWSKYQGKVSQVSNDVNDTYLKGNGQAAGVASYGMMVDLVIAYYHTYGTI